MKPINSYLTCYDQHKTQKAVLVKTVQTQPVFFLVLVFISNQNKIKKLKKTTPGNQTNFLNFRFNFKLSKKTTPLVQSRIKGE